MQHAGDVEVVDVVVIAQGVFRGAMAGERSAHAAVAARLGDRLAAPGLRDQLDSVHDLDVAGAAAQVHVDGLRDLGAAGARIPGREMVGAQRDAGDAEAALEAGGGREGIADERAFGGRKALEGEDFLAVGRRGRRGAGDLGVPVNQGEATAALALRAAAVLERCDAAPLAQRLEQRLIGPRLDLARGSIQHERDRHPLSGVRDGRGITGG